MTIAPNPNPNTAPAVTIAAPDGGASYVEGQTIPLAASADDAEDGDLTAALSWTSSRDGAIGVGGSFSTTTLSVGSHTITAQATDSLGLSGSAEFNITIIGSNTTEIRVSAGSDDAEERASNGNVIISSPDIDLISDRGKDQIVGLRFNAVNIPQGSQILTAYVQFRVDEANIGAASLLIQGQNSDNAGAFTGAPNEISARPRTTMAAAWSPIAWTTIGEEGPNQRTSDIAGRSFPAHLAGQGPDPHSIPRP